MDCSYIERRCIRDRSRFGLAERGLVNWNGGARREKRDLSVDASGIQRGHSGSWLGIDTFFTQSGYFFYPIIPDQTIKSDQHWSGVGRPSSVKVA